MVRMSAPSAQFLEALRVLQEAGREDLLKPGVLSQAWVPKSMRPTWRASSRVAAAALACSPPKAKAVRPEGEAMGQRGRAPAHLLPVARARLRCC